jgi:hypothetical protein
VTNAKQLCSIFETIQHGNTVHKILHHSGYGETRLTLQVQFISDVNCKEDEGK